MEYQQPAIRRRSSRALALREAEAGSPSSNFRLFGTNAISLTGGSARRARRRNLLALLALSAAYILVYLYRKPGTASRATGNLQKWGLDMVRPRPAPELVVHTPGFEGAPHSCHVADMPKDPLVHKYGQNNIRLSRSYEGSGARVRRMLQKALSGQPIHIAVVGGSVSSGHGVTPPFTHENYMYKRIHHWFEQTFPQAQHVLNTDSIIPATTAWYFSYCVLETLPDDADLVLLELDINHHDPAPESLRTTEALFRTILDAPSKPALIYMSVFALVFHDMTHGWRHSALLSQWLDVPEINIRNWILPHILKNPDMAERHFYNHFAKLFDPRHVNEFGHVAMGDMVIAYLREQLCMLQRGQPAEISASSDTWPDNDITFQLPRLGMLDKYDDTSRIPRLNPKCSSITSVKTPLVPSRMDRWQSVNHNDKRSYESTVIGGEIEFKVSVATGALGIIFWETNDEAFGRVKCWLDNDTSPERLRYLSGYNVWHPYSTFELSYDMWNDVEPGSHTLTCQLIEGEKGGTVFRIAATVSR